MKNKNNIAEMETKLAQLKANHVDTPAQAKARKLIKPLLISFPLIFIIAFIIMIIDVSNDPTPAVTTSTEQASPYKAIDEANAEKWEILEEVSDCELAFSIYRDYAPIIASLEQFVISNPGMAYQQAVQWKQSTKFDERLATIEAKYPTSYNVEMENSILAHGFNFSAGQYWRDMFSTLRHSPIGTQLISEQTSLMNDDLQLLKNGCPQQFANL
ncbi:hypothetical protein [Shewanella sp.]|uniref:hypothetical protein n=1 Tax=Shewanella sp. TaxID=50422 RepID=UPI00258DCE50|nr:hypothetical protein [Shewanella sp.]MCJ8305095.1 hypothetical protein [Shewanella sp.]